MRGKVFTPEELYNGVPTAQGTVRLTSKDAVEAYYKRRLVADAYYGIQNYNH